MGPWLVSVMVEIRSAIADTDVALPPQLIVRRGKDSFQPLIT